jgi:hypothetical protein
MFQAMAAILERAAISLVSVGTSNAFTIALGEVMCRARISRRHSG